MGSMGAVIIMKAAVIILAFVAAASAVTYKGTQTIKVGKKTYKCTFNIEYSTDPATCKKKTVKCKPALKKNTKFTIEHNGATISGTTAKNKISSCKVAYTAPTTMEELVQEMEDWPHFLLVQMEELMLEDWLDFFQVPMEEEREEMDLD